MSKSVVFSIAASACLFALVCADTSRACGGGGGGGGGKSGGFGGGAVAYATSFNTGFNPGFARGGGFNPVAAQKQYLAAQAASRRARLKPARIARTIKQREEMLASRAARRDVLIAQRLERERQKAQQQPLE
ncbi:MAG: hypothetical protein QF805_24075, partial [Pirellulaceae bacterium]|nr:hypothetical protein [Pirellulaceae bacterium]